MALTPLPSPPSRDDPANFSARADALLAALPQLVLEINAMLPGDSAASLAQTLGLSLTELQGSGIVAHDWRRSYAAGTMGAALTDADAPSILWILSPAQRADVLTYGYTQDLTAAIANAYALCKAWRWPAGGYLLSGATGWMAPSDGARIVGSGVGVSIIKYVGTGTAIDYDGKDYVTVRDVQIRAATAAVAVDIGDIAHYYRLVDCDIRGSSTGARDAGSPNAGTGVQVERSYYGVIERNDISYWGTGIYGCRENNGNTWAANSVRQCLVGMDLTDVTSNSEGICIIGGNIETAQTAAVAGIRVRGHDDVKLIGVRIEISSGNSTCYHLVVEPGVTGCRGFEARGCSLSGDDKSIKMGSGSATHKVIGARIDGGYSASDIVIMSDCEDLEIAGGGAHAAVSGAGGALTDNGVRTVFELRGLLNFTGQLTGVSGTPPTGVISYTVEGDVVILSISGLTGNSNASTCTITGMPAKIRPKGVAQTMLVPVYDNSVAVLGSMTIGTDGVMTLSAGPVAGVAFSSGGAKGIAPITVPYKRT